VKFDTALDKDIVKTITGKYWVDKTPQAFTYDLDGNMLTDGKWNFSWDGENRLLSSTNAANTQKLEFAYDYQSRRVSKKVYTKTAEATEWTLAKTEKFVYDKWNCIAVFDASNALQKSMLWGEDLSGSMQGAGGIGGLLAENNANGTYLPGYDGNGNVMAYYDTTGSIVAEYVYDAFGRTIFKTGTKASDFAYGFSTKPLDTETGFVYYIYRYYSPDMGRWINRDPIGEKGGENIYCFVNNHAVSYCDYNGLFRFVIKSVDVTRPDQKPIPQPPQYPGRYFLGITNVKNPYFITREQDKKGCFVVDFNGKAIIKYWYVGEEVKQHELQHVAKFESRYNQLKNYLESFLPSQKICEVTVSYLISYIHSVVHYYRLKASVENFEWDVNEANSKKKDYPYALDNYNELSAKLPNAENDIRKKHQDLLINWKSCK